MSGFWRGRRVFVTGHTGFKGAWLSVWLHRLGAVVRGFALPPPTKPSLFELASVGSLVDHVEGDVRDAAAVARALADFAPEVVLHLAAQPLVRASYADPVETYSTNVLGTVHVLEAVRRCASVQSTVIVTSDKCYENREWVWGYREDEPMGGHDPYSASKGCAEIVAASYRRSFDVPGLRNLATARAGNVIGGGDFARDRLVPDVARAFLAREPVVLRNPRSIRPWQHVLEPLGGYLSLAEKLAAEGERFASAWNFGPADADTLTVAELVGRLASKFGPDTRCTSAADGGPHEARMLRLDISKARAELGWRPRLALDTALDWVVEHYRAGAKGDARTVTESQIARFQGMS